MNRSPKIDKDKFLYEAYAKKEEEAEKAAKIDLERRMEEERNKKEEEKK